MVRLGGGDELFEGRMVFACGLMNKFYLTMVRDFWEKHILFRIVGFEGFYFLILLFVCIYNILFESSMVLALWALYPLYLT